MSNDSASPLRSASTTPAKSRSPTPDSRGSLLTGFTLSTQYQFITTTGDDTRASIKRKLKIVRSHVMRNYVQQRNSKNSTGSDASRASTSPEGENTKGESQVVSIPSQSRDMREIKRRSRNSEIVNEVGHETLKNEDLSKGRSRGYPSIDAGYGELLIRPSK